MPSVYNLGDALLRPLFRDLYTKLGRKLAEP